MCEHLIKLEKAIQAAGIKETFRGQAWSDNCREWVYFDCRLHIDKVTQLFALPPCVELYSNEDERSGLEQGFVCVLCHDAIMGVHPRASTDRQVPLFPPEHERETR
ncbi:MAG: hypothetical protein R2794_00350 [Chitinophagales bacterium]